MQTCYTCTDASSCHFVNYGGGSVESYDKTALLSLQAFFFFLKWPSCREKAVRRRKNAWMTSREKTGDEIEAARSNFPLSSLRVHTVYWLTYCIYFQCVFLLCSSCSPQPLTYSRYLSFGLSLLPSFPGGWTLASKICYIDQFLLLVSLTDETLGDITKYRTTLSPNHTELRQMTATGSCLWV